MLWRALTTCAALLILGGLTALSGADAVERFKRAMSNDDAYEKRDAINALVSSSADDDTVLPLLVGAVSDRQAGRFAIPALRRRTGLNPPQGDDSPGYPGYPTDDTGAAWNQWLSARKAAQEEAAKLDEAVSTAEAAKAEAELAKQEAKAAQEAGSEKATDRPEGESDGENAGEGKEADPDAQAAEADGETNAEESAVSAGPRDKLDRIFFTDGSILRCYVVLKRTNLAGELTSVRILHQEGGGEEIIDAAIIARIEEDYQ